MAPKVVGYYIPKGTVIKTSFDRIKTTDHSKALSLDDIYKTLEWVNNNRLDGGVAMTSIANDLNNRGLMKEAD